MKYLSESKKKKAIAVRKTYQVLGSLTVNDLKSMIRMNLIRDNKVTTEDVNLAEETLGPYVGTLKGKAVRTAQPTVIDYHAEILKELLSINTNVIISIDRFTVNKLVFLISIGHDLYYRTAAKLVSLKFKSFIERINEIVRICKKGGFKVVEIHTDKQLALVLDEYIKDKNITTIYAGSREYVPRAERNNRVIEERAQCIYH